ncbi:hypothetical protein AVHY2522_23805 [Acidovorax sp. SUPP2522]|uniref:hypothetical protein n=1 Tax=unclassified Acidovorax TaxID=2684926 RepID=UPI00234A8EC1|nr:MULTISPECIES: hypothetical protein [unclassified Acidovorax]WCM96239.1 hypothetical protein M5C96_17610 [Acidovorax sp. GBBC 1281]GKT19798.1 hypothetical protein AVHY2522_23805 [Acidovorax sp. SUPP2522]
MKLCSPSSEPLHVALTSGHMCVIGPDGTDVPKIFIREALARGAVAPDETQTSSVNVQIQARQMAVSEALQAMITGQDKEDFTADGKPNLMRLKSRAGFAVTREEADAIFAELTDKV